MESSVGLPLNMPETDTHAGITGSSVLSTGRSARMILQDSTALLAPQNVPQPRCKITHPQPAWRPALHRHRSSDESSAPHPVPVLPVAASALLPIGCAHCRAAATRLAPGCHPHRHMLAAARARGCCWSACPAALTLPQHHQGAAPAAHCDASPGSEAAAATKIAAERQREYGARSVHRYFHA